MNALNLEEARFNMIEQQIRTWDVLDDQILETLANTPREDFVAERYRALAFSDISVPLAHEQVMMPPKLEGRLLQSLLLKPTDSVLEIGTGSGYLTACLAKLAGSVHSVDIFADFIEEAGSKLEKHDINNATFENIDAATGLDTPQRYDAIAVTGSLPVLHHGYHELLNPGGRLFVIVGKPPIMQTLLITRSGDQEWREESLFEISIPPLINAPQPDAFRF